MKRIFRECTVFEWLIVIPLGNKVFKLTDDYQEITTSIYRYKEKVFEERVGSLRFA